MPRVLHTLIGSIFDPLSDGNCGFRCIAQALYNDQDQWRKVRQDMAQEMLDNKPFYTNLLGGEKEFNKTFMSVNPVMASVIRKSHWLSKLEMGQIVADTFKRPICFWSLAQSSCYIPHKVGPETSSLAINICFVSGCHWVLVEPLTPNTFPVPPFVKVPRGYYQKRPLWQTHLKDLLQSYQSLIK